MIRALAKAWPVGALSVGALAAGIGLADFAAAPVRAATTWVKDPQTGCATSNPFPNPNESIRWFGNCSDGKLDGRGTLVWYRDDKETERNEGNFKQGEMDGFAATTYPEGSVVYGQYKQGQRHGQFMTVRATGEHIAATYFEGELVSQQRLTAIEAQAWRQRGGAQLIAAAPPPAPPPGAAAAKKPAPEAADPEDEFITGRTAVASPSRQLPPRPKPAAAVPKPAQTQTAAAQTAPTQSAPSQPAGTPNFVLGTQVIEAITPSPGMTAPSMTAPGMAAQGMAAPAVTAPAMAVAAPVVAAPAAIAAAAAPGFAAPVAPASAAPVAPASTATATPASTAKPAQDPGGIYFAGPSLTSPPLPGSAKTQPAPQPAVASPPAASTAPVAPAPQPAARYQLAAPVPPAAPSLPPPVPSAATIASPSLPGLPATATQPVPTIPQGAVAASGRRPPWMIAGASDPVLMTGQAMPGQTPPPLAPTPMAGAAPLAGPPVAYAAPVYAPPPNTQGYQPLADQSPTAASREYLAQREAAQVAQAMTLPSYRAMQSASPMAPPSQAIPGQSAGTLTNLPAANVTAYGALHSAGSTEAMFKDAYKLEMSGRLREAEQAYEQIMLAAPNNQTAMLANERLNGLRRTTREQSVRIAEQPRVNERQSAVVAVNEPRSLPRYAQPTGARPVALSDSGAGDSSGGMVANLTGLSVCSQAGMYDKESRWCGIVLADDGARLSVEIKDVVLPGFGNIGIQSSKCTGGTFINWFSRGSMVRVPRSCMELKS